MAEDFAYCIRCRRPAPPDLDGPPGEDPGPWDAAAWEVTEDGEELICPGCLTGEDEAAIAESFIEYDPLVQIPLLISEFEAGHITGGEFEDRLAQQGLFVEAMEGSEDAERAARLLKEACSKLPPESVGDLLARVYRVLDKHADLLDELDEETR